jgi:voltage-gated potassium channel Kch
VRVALHRLRRWWAAWQWPVVWSIGLLALGFGVEGFHRYYAGRRDWWDALYLAVQLFTMESGAVPPPLPWTLQLARIFAPFVTGYTATKALMVLFRSQLERLRLRGTSGHAVVCGLGRKGMLVADAFLRGGWQVVVVEANEANPWIPLCRERGMMIVIGDATSPGVLESVGVARARYLVAVAADDGDNAEIAIRGRQLPRRTNVPLTCLVHVGERALYDRLRDAETTTPHLGSARLEVFNLFERAGRALVTDWPPAGVRASCSA